jgi:membrane peptidoglycan carboxypeptidase
VVRSPVGPPPWGGSEPAAGGGRDRGGVRRRRLRSALTVVTVVALVGVLAVAGVISASPEVEDAPARVDALLAAHGGHRVRVGGDAKLARAIVAVEDHRFYDHAGVDPLAFARILLRSLASPGRDPGGSTIALQLAKLLYTGAAHDPGTAITQLGVALKLERRHTKDELLDLYLNAVYFGDGRYGADSASRHYTGHGAADLTWGEASLLAGMVQAPTRYAQSLDAARRRQRHVLDRLTATGVLTPAEADAAYAEPLRRFAGLAG